MLFAIVAYPSLLEFCRKGDSPCHCGRCVSRLGISDWYVDLRLTKAGEELHPHQTKVEEDRNESMGRLWDLGD